MSGGEVIEGFLCPLCMKDLGDVIQLQVIHDRNQISRMQINTSRFILMKPIPKKTKHLYNLLKSFSARPSGS